MDERRVRSLSFAVTVIAISIAIGSSVRAQADDDLIVVDIGEGFVEREAEACFPADPGGRSREFVGELGLVCIVREAPLDPAEVVQHVESQRDLAGIDFPIGDVSPSVAQILDAESANPVYAASFGVGPYYYTVYFIRSVVDVPSFDPEQFVAGLVRAHVDLSESDATAETEAPGDAGGASTGTAPDAVDDRRDDDAQQREIDAGLAVLLGAVDGFVRTGPPMTDVHLASGLEGSGDLTRAFTDGTTSVLQFYGDDEGLMLGVFAVRYRFPLFAAAVLGDRSTVGIDPSIGVPSERPRTDLGAIVDESGQVTGAAFRHGDIFYLVVTAAGDDGAPQAVRSAVERLATALYDAGPGGATSPFSFATPQQAVIQTALLTAALVLAILLVRRLSSHRALRVSGANQHDLIDVSARAAAIRRHSRILVGIQLVALSTIVVALAVLRGAGAWVVAGLAFVAAVLAGIVVRRLDRPGSGRRLVAPAPRGVVIGLLALMVLVVGVTLLIRGLSTWLFTPWLDHLELSDDVGIEPTTLSRLMVAAGFGLCILGGVAVRSARRLGRGPAERARTADTRAEVLYLRSFADDDRRIPTVASSRRPFLETFSIRGTEPFEDSLAWQLDGFGPVVALELPTQSTATLGAFRERLGSDWQPGLIERLARAARIVIVIGTSGGLRWEMDRIVRDGHLGKTIIVVPPVDDDEARRRWSEFKDIIAAAGVAVTTTVDAAGALTLEVADSGRLTGFTADCRDEAGYRAALDAASAQFAPPDPSTRLTSAAAAGPPGGHLGP